MTSRRRVLGGGLLLALASPAARAAVLPLPEAQPFGLVGRIMAKPGTRDALIAALVQGTGRMPGCLSYVVHEDAGDPNAVLVSEAWESAAAHRASLDLPAVRAAIAKARPVIAKMETIATTRPFVAT